MTAYVMKSKESLHCTKLPLSRLGLNLHPYDIWLATVAIKRDLDTAEKSLLNQNLYSRQILQILSSNTREQEVQIQPTMA